MRRPCHRLSYLPPLVASAALIAAAPAVAGWRTEDPACDPAKQPGAPKTYALSGLLREAGETNWVEPWADWWSACTTAEDGPVPSVCHDGDEQRVLEKEGACLSFTCRAGTYDIRSCTDPGHTTLPRVAGVALFPDGYVILIEHSRGSHEDKVAPAEVPLAFALRALMSGAKLPDAAVKRIPASFWTRQRRISVVEKIHHAVTGDPGTTLAASQ